MKYTHNKLKQILRQFIAAEKGETGDYPELDDVLRDVAKYSNDFEAELREIEKTWHPGSIEHNYLRLIKEILGE